MTTATRYAASARSLRTELADSLRANDAWEVLEESRTLHNVTMESGAQRTLTVHFRLEGAIAPARDNLVLVVHALTGTSHASDWWRNVIHAGGAIDPTRHAVLCATLDAGDESAEADSSADTTSSKLSVRDHATVLARLLDTLDVRIPLLLCGGSLGGMVALEFAALFPERIRAAVVLAAPAAQTAQGIAWNTIMRRAIEVGGPRDGLALARMVGMLSYRTPNGLERRFGRAPHAQGEFAMSAWLTGHGERLVERFSARRYGALLAAMDTHDVGRGRGGIAKALSGVGSRLTGVGIPGDLLYPSDTVQQWTTESGATYHELPSEHGHDAFLIEGEQVSRILRAAITKARTPTRAASLGSAVRPLRVALAGCGHVGGALLEMLGEHTDGAPGTIRVDRILVRQQHRTRPPVPRGIQRGVVAEVPCITDPTQLMEGKVDVLVEAIGGVSTARRLVQEALQRGIRVVTANKALLAVHGPELVSLARVNGTRIDFEGAVGGAVPVVRCLRTGATGVGVTRIDAILNGTSNFVLGRAGQLSDMRDAVRAAQQLGFAEADPARDLSGEDAEDKLRVLAWLAFGVHPAALHVIRHGIDAAVWAQACTASVSGDLVKLLASCTFEDGQLIGRITPTLCSTDSPWAAVHEADNRVVVASESAGAIVLQGPGAGGRATAGALLSDLLAPPHCCEELSRSAPHRATRIGRLT